MDAKHVSPPSAEPEVAQIRAREQAATPGPWLYQQLAIRAEVMIHGEDLKHVVIDADAKDVEVWRRIGHTVCGLACTRGKYEREEANGKFIAHDVRQVGERP